MTEDFFQKQNIFLIVGATNNEEKYGYKVFVDLKNAEYNVVGINKRIGGKEEIQGTPSYSSINAFFTKISGLFNKQQVAGARKNAVAVLIIPPENTMPMLEEVKENKITKVWFQPGAQSEEALEFCQKNNIQTIHDQCIMITRPK